MGWAVGFHEGRWIGYGVPSKCDHPECDADIDRGLSYRCGDMEDEGCDGFFCSEHLSGFVETDDGGGVWVCERCAENKPPFDPKPDTREWLEHQLTDESWQQWRDENPAQVGAARAAIREAKEA